MLTIRWLANWQQHTKRTLNKRQPINTHVYLPNNTSHGTSSSTWSPVCSSWRDCATIPRYSVTLSSNCTWQDDRIYGVRYLLHQTREGTFANTKSKNIKCAYIEMPKFSWNLWRHVTIHEGTVLDVITSSHQMRYSMLIDTLTGRQFFYRCLIQIYLHRFSRT